MYGDATVLTFCQLRFLLSTTLDAVRNAASPGGVEPVEPSFFGDCSRRAPRPPHSRLEPKGGEPQ